MTSSSPIDRQAFLMDFVPEHTISFSDLNVKTIKEELTKQLESKERLFGELGGGGISRNVLQRQIKRLEDIEQMDEREEIDSDHRMKLQSLERELSAFKVFIVFLLIACHPIFLWYINMFACIQSQNNTLPSQLSVSQAIIQVLCFQHLSRTPRQPSENRKFQEVESAILTLSLRPK
jgi:hypothetical protein